MNKEAIYRQDVLDLAKKGVLISNGNYESVCKAINELPPVNPQPKMGLWIGIDEEPHEVWECDHCGFVIDGSGCIDPYDYRDIYKFCPNCGCHMDEPQERSDKG